VVPPSAFILIAVLISAFLLWQLWNSTSLLVGLAFGLIIGGAIGNVIDRAIYGAVVDFILLSWKTWSWPVFNIADTAITCGVVLILIDSLWPDRRSTK
jgi:signal peptidase II